MPTWIWMSLSAGIFNEGAGWRRDRVLNQGRTCEARQLFYEICCSSLQFDRRRSKRTLVRWTWQQTIIRWTWQQTINRTPIRWDRPTDIPYTIILQRDVQQTTDGWRSHLKHLSGNLLCAGDGNHRVVLYFKIIIAYNAAIRTHLWQCDQRSGHIVADRRRHRSSLWDKVVSHPEHAGSKSDTQPVGIFKYEHLRRVFVRKFEMQVPTASEWRPSEYRACVFQETDSAISVQNANEGPPYRVRSR